MKTLILSYTHTGRNKELATRIAKSMDIDHMEVAEDKCRKTMTVAWDLLLNRTPKVSPDTSIMDKYDMVVLCAPIWMGMPSTPIRAYLKHLAKSKQQYAFVSLSGGADNNNPDFSKQLIKVIGYEPVEIVDMYVRSLLPNEPAPTRDDTQHYPVTANEYDNLCSDAVAILSKI